MMSSRPKVYVAGPISLGDRVMNIATAVSTGIVLIHAGFAPFVPHAFESGDFDHDTWLAVDFEFVRVCDALLRLPGDSVGADKEVALAEELGIPVFYSVAGLKMWAGVQ